ncbi:ergothioneine biosynthesis protein EgtB [Trichocoleus sp. FACHB-591]|uniref:SUMF1/EgtB/PvdO family nonheme iron enzyme n=1 Tax=Trichocoleus sp. FACHB-591 TaxID=2692872 RepID=UPI0016836A2A|nr:SUMF1/EgtB/PvdO family nonheme iron enzyme [Trichocoleus sp. FACHB-591]MBD2098715.1 ergothioneine biosynthesis protein EgtB [Trichocoleus sp. FACHB-591]
MTSTSRFAPSDPQLRDLELRRQQIQQALQDCRAGTLALFQAVDSTTFCQQIHPEFSPIGWHLGHIAFTEGLWILEHCAGQAPLLPQYRRLFAADGLPKAERCNLPNLADTYMYLDTVRTQVLQYLEVAPLGSQERLWHWLLQHESQHCETISFLLQLQRWTAELKPSSRLDQPQQHSDLSEFEEMVCIPAGAFQQGNDSLDAIDNERPVHWVDLDTYWIDRYPVTNGQYRKFIAAGGYQNPHWWSESGWQWRQANSITQPLYWPNDPAWADHPVCGVSCYEAEAYARFVQKRLPTEAEWEKAASWHPQKQQRQTYPWGEAFPSAESGIGHSNHDHLEGQTTPVDAYPKGQSFYGCYDMLGNVWEWTASWFDGYDGFEFYPYRGYSQVYFDGQHRVLRGGSWVTRPWGLRCAFRNWYEPGTRQILAGFRCVRDVESPAA